MEREIRRIRGRIEVVSMKTKLITLIAIGIISAYIWRLEVELRGWTGLVWISYFHIAIPVGILLFGAWVLVFNTFESNKKNLLFISMYLVLMITFYILGYTTILILYSRWFFAPEFPSLAWFYNHSFFFVFFLFPVCYFTLVKSLNRQMKLHWLAISFVCYIISFPVSQSILRIIEHKGGYDFLHAIKSGFVIPFLFLSFGLPYVLYQKRD